MIIYLIRHAIAVPHGTRGVEEDDRYLTEEGIEKMKKSAAGLRALRLRPDLILTSPLVRARQTAEIVQAILDREIPIEFTDELSPSGNRKALYDILRRHAKLGDIMLVGHQPSLGEIGGEIAWGSAESCLELKKGGACGLEIETLEPIPQGFLLWLLTPAILRSVR
jgi:phosphohistidine phosphatase